MKKTIIILWRDSAQLSADEDGTTQYGIIYDKVGYSGIKVTFSDGKLERIMINNTKNQ